MPRSRRSLAALSACLALTLAGQGRAAIGNLVVTTAGGYVLGLTAAGGISVAFCTGLVGIQGVVVADRYPLPLELGGVSVKVSGLPAPIYAVARLDGYYQVNFQVPFEVTDPLPVVEVAQAGSSARLTSAYVAFPADFFRDSQGYGAIQHADYTPVTTAAPARPGEVVAAYATGLGAVSPPVPTGYPAPLAPLSTLAPMPQESPPSVVISGSDAQVLYAGVTPGLAGVYQINFRIPDAVPPGDLTLAFERTYCASPFGMACSGSGGRLTRATSGTVKIPIR